MDICMFMSSVLSSLVATIIAAICAFLFKERLKALFKRWVINILDMGTFDVFPNEVDTTYCHDITEEFHKAKFIHIFAGRGKFLCNEPYRTVLSKKNIEINILLPDIENIYKIDWIATALNKITHHEPYREQISASIKYILSLTETNSNIKLKEYHAVAIGKIIITDRFVYFKPYTNDFSDNNPIYKYKSGSYMYMWAIKYFNSYWDPKYTNISTLS